MATKYLARTAIEGGRGNRWERDLSHREERATTRAYLSKATDEDFVDGRVIEHRRKIYKDFRDKLSAVRRWLDKNCGRPWVDVKRDIHAMFDDRTTAGRHIMYDHMLNDVQDFPEDVKNWYSRGSYIVDPAGLLRKREVKRYNYSREKRTQTDAAVIAWADNRMIRVVGSKLFWCVRDRISSSHYCPEIYREASGANYYCRYCRQHTSGFRQHKSLDAGDTAFYNSLASFEKNLVTLATVE